LPTRPELSAAGKSVVITGGGTGIGKATAVAFAQAGAKSVSIVGRRVDRLQTAAAAIMEANPSTQVVLQTGDVSNRTSLEVALSAIVAKIGAKIDIFLNNAGMLPEQAAVIDYPESEVRRSFEVNLMGSFNALQVFTPLAAPGAKLLNIGSAISHWSPLPEVPGVWSYAAAKAAALKMMEYYASENPDIHVVSIQPGIVGTEINPNIPVGPDTGICASSIFVPSGGWIRCIMILTPLPVELPAHFLVWLASDEAAFLRNKFVWANWDVDELKARAEEIQSSSLLRISLNGVDM
jgi:NAD(P)-dependent dehydrogenase (short-subunit alcohol dehydrogenase family)